MRIKKPELKYDIHNDDISGYHGNDYEDDCLLAWKSNRPVDGSSKRL
jgi:hypothetical protein